MKPYSATNHKRHHEPERKIHGRECTICYPDRTIRTKGPKFGRRGSAWRVGWVLRLNHSRF